MMSLGGLHDASSERDACGVGFVAHVRGEKSRAIVDDALAILARLAHRAATGADVDTGDGAGIHLQLPHRFFKAEALRLGIEVPRRRRYGIGQLFLPAEPQARAACEQIVADVVAEEGQQVLGWREVEIDATQVGPVARAVLPVMRQVYVRMRRVPPTAFERTLFVIRRLIEQRVRQRGVDPTGTFHVASLSTETIVYKGLLLPERLPRVLRRPAPPRAGVGDRRGALALLDQHLPDLGPGAAVPLHRPQRRDQHAARQHQLDDRAPQQAAESPSSAAGSIGLQPIIVPGKSDSAQFDNMLELLVRAGRSVPHAMMMMIPEAWEGHADMPDELRAFYRVRGLAGRAVGRPGGDRVQRRHPGRRHAGSQRPAAGALGAHRRRSRDPGVGGWRARPAAGAHRAEGPAHAGAHAAGRHRELGRIVDDDER
jgi:glutamate synthase (NADPH/NADH) large chain